MDMLYYVSIFYWAVIELDCINYYWIPKAILYLFILFIMNARKPQETYDFSIINNSAHKSFFITWLSLKIKSKHRKTSKTSLVGLISKRRPFLRKSPHLELGKVISKRNGKSLWDVAIKMNSSIDSTYVLVANLKPL